MLSSSAFLARILDNEKAEILGSVDCGISIFTAGVAIVGAITTGSSSLCEAIGSRVEPVVFSSLIFEL